MTVPASLADAPVDPRERTALLSARGIRKGFGSNPVLRGVSLELQPGEIRGLLGANGAGKSTFIKILSGIHRPDEGTFAVRSREGSGAGALRFIHQDLGIVDELLVRDNLFLGERSSAGGSGWIDAARERRAARELLELVELDVDPDARTSTLTLGAKTLVAVARALGQHADVLVLDEATAALTQGESARVLKEARAFADRGGAVLVVSHRLAEIADQCDTITILRDGVVAHDAETPDATTLHALLSDAEVAGDEQREPPPADAPVVLRAQGASTEGTAPLDLEVRAGEVVSLVGSLASRLYRVGHLLAGHAPRDGGRVEVLPRSGRGPGRVAIVPEDRKAQGLLSNLDVTTNVGASSMGAVARGGWVRRSRERDRAEAMMRTVNVQPHDPDLSVGALSGGNQQKVLFGRTLLQRPDVYVLCEPTRGVDVGTRAAIRRLIGELRRDGAAIVVVTIDIDDALAVSDRIAAVQDGRVGPPIDRSEIDLEDLIERVS